MMSKTFFYKKFSIFLPFRALLVEIHLLLNTMAVLDYVLKILIVLFRLLKNSHVLLSISSVHLFVK